jgi:hypothetical protein
MQCFGRKFWELERARSTRSQNALSSEPEAGSTEYGRMQFWCRTHGQCAAVTEYIAESLFPKVAQDIMVDAPGVRELKVEHRFQAHDKKLASIWTDDLIADSTRNRRDIALEELNRLAGEVPLKFSASSLKDKAARRNSRFDVT